MSARPSAALPAADRTRRDLPGIAALFTDMAGGFNARDVAVADQGFTCDVSVVAPDGRRVDGIDALLRYHAMRLSGPASTWRTSYRVLGTTFVDHHTAVVHTAQDTTTGNGAFRNHGTFVVVERDCRWWIAAGHNTNVEADGRPG